MLPDLQSYSYTQTQRIDAEHKSIAYTTRRKHKGSLIATSNGGNLTTWDSHKSLQNLEVILVERLRLVILALRSATIDDVLLATTLWFGWLTFMKRDRWQRSRPSITEGVVTMHNATFITIPKLL
ncbi:hypothetical protein CJF32_00005944 [Rutstroemia sp. NJR-2017a WRK4]|nr:hypothetical protein CJF32_00005944 [Rutstroemia sp. NJR-2017a WRK4]